MLKKIEILTSINYSFYTTVYLYDRDEKIILPADIPGVLKSTPKMHKLLNRILSVMATDINNIQIFSHDDETFYSHVILEKKKKLYSVEADFAECLEIAVAENIPIMIDSATLKKQGIKITPELLKEALEQD